MSSPVVLLFSVATDTGFFFLVRGIELRTWSLPGKRCVAELYHWPFILKTCYCLLILCYTFLVGVYSSGISLQLYISLMTNDIKHVLKRLYPFW